MRAAKASGKGCGDVNNDLRAVCLVRAIVVVVVRSVGDENVDVVDCWWVGGEFVDERRQVEVGGRRYL